MVTTYHRKLGSPDILADTLLEIMEGDGFVEPTGCANCGAAERLYRDWRNKVWVALCLKCYRIGLKAEEDAQSN